MGKKKQTSQKKQAKRSPSPKKPAYVSPLEGYPQGPPTYNSRAAARRANKAKAEATAARPRSPSPKRSSNSSRASSAPSSPRRSNRSSNSSAASSASQKSHEAKPNSQLNRRRYVKGGKGFDDRANFRRRLWTNQSSRFQWLLNNLTTDEAILNHIQKDGRVAKRHFFFKMGFMDGLNEAPSTLFVKEARPAKTLKLKNGETRNLRARPYQAVPVRLVDTFRRFNDITLGQRQVTSWASFVKANHKRVANAVSSSHSGEFANAKPAQRISASTAVLKVLYEGLSAESSKALKEGERVSVGQQAIDSALAGLGGEVSRRLVHGKLGRQKGEKKEVPKTEEMFTQQAVTKSKLADLATTNFTLFIGQYCDTKGRTDTQLVVAIRNVMSRLRNIPQRLTRSFLLQLNRELGMAQQVFTGKKDAKGRPLKKWVCNDGIALLAGNEARAKERLVNLTASKSGALSKLIQRLLREGDWSGTEEELVHAAQSVVNHYHKQNDSLPKRLDDTVRDVFARSAGAKYVRSVKKQA